MEILEAYTQISAGVNHTKGSFKEILSNLYSHVLYTKQNDVIAIGETQSYMPVHSYHPQVKSPFSPVTEYSVSITEYSVSVKVKYDNPDVLCISERDNGKAISITLYYIYAGIFLE